MANNKPIQQQNATEETYADVWDLYHALASPSNLPEHRDPRLSEDEQETLIHDGLQLFCEHFRSLWL